MGNGLKRYDLFLGYNKNQDLQADMNESLKGEYVLYSDIEPLIEAIKTYAKKENWTFSRTSEERGYPVRIYKEELNIEDLEVLEWEDSFGAKVPVEYSGKTAREALAKLGIKNEN